MEWFLGQRELEESEHLAFETKGKDGLWLGREVSRVIRERVLSESEESLER